MSDSEIEQWRPVPGTPEYAVSDLGRVRLPTGHVTRGYPNGGYLRVQIRGRWQYVQRMVLYAFSRSRSDNVQASHVNGDRADNRLDNLRWESPSVNTKRKAEHGTQVCGENHPSARLTQAQALEILRLRRENQITATDVARSYSISRRSASDLLDGTTWKHLQVEP